jgi:hypothetical protein
MSKGPAGPRIWITGFEARIIMEELCTALRNPERQHNERRLKVVKVVENIKVRMEAASIEAAQLRRNTAPMRTQ